MPVFLKSFKTQIIIIVLFCINVLVYANLTTQYGGTDLRCRIVGARLFNDVRSPYFSTWEPGQDEKFLDPNVNLNRKVNGNIVTPAYLVSIQPLSALPYSYILIIWTTFQYLFIGVLIFLILHYLPAPKQNTNWRLIITCLVFLYTDIWMFNIERGQTYSLYALLVGYIILSGLNPLKNAAVIAGFINGIVVFFRPSFALLIIPFFLRKNYKFCLMFLLGFVTGIIIFVIPFYSLWIDYFNAMQEYANEIIKGVPPVTNINNLPHTIENMSSLQNFKSDFTVTAIPTMQACFQNIGVVVDAKISMLACAIIISLYTFFFFRLKLFSGNIKTILFSFLLYITVEYFFVGSRSAYALIQWFLPVYILFSNGFSITRFIIIALAFSQILMIPSFNFLYSVQIQGIIGEGILYFLCLYDIFLGNAGGQQFKNSR